MEVFRSEFKVIEHFVGTRIVLGCPMLVFKLSAIINQIFNVFFCGLRGLILSPKAFSVCSIPYGSELHYSFNKLSV